MQHNPPPGDEPLVSPTPSSRYERRHAPKGGLKYRDKPYRSGQFVPGSVMLTHTPRRSPIRDPNTYGPPNYYDEFGNSSPRPTEAPPLSFDSPESFGESLGRHMGHHLDDPEHRQRHADAANFVASNIPHAIIERLGNHLKSARSHPHSDSVQEHWHSVGGDPLEQDEILEGFYDGSSGHMSVNGEDPHGTLAHEIGHAADRSFREDHGIPLSASQDFRNAWWGELAGGKLSDYAKHSPAEAFAEACRLVWGTPGGKETAKKHIPKTYALFWKHGLI